MPKSAIVIGATGVVGRALVEQLADAPHIASVASVTRRPVQYRNDKITNHVVDFEQLDDASDIFQGDLLFSCLGTTRSQAGSISAQRVVDYDYQLHAATLAANNGVSHYLLVSSSAANTCSASPYLRMKGELEDAVNQLPFKRVSIFQPSLLLGERPEARPAETVGALIMPTLCKLPILKKYRPIRGDQVAAKMVSVSNSEGQGLHRFTLDEIFMK